MNTQGFTLVETLVGLFIAVTAALSVSQVIASTNRVIEAGRNTFVATNLAHEGIELTRAMRDNAWFASSDRSKWLSDSDICQPTDTGLKTYQIGFRIARGDYGGKVIRQGDPNWTTSTLYIEKEGDNPGLWKHSATDYKNGISTPSQATPYTRIMTVDCTHANGATLNDPGYVTVTATVSWTNAQSVAKSVALTEKLYNWLK